MLAKNSEQPGLYMEASPSRQWFIDTGTTIRKWASENAFQKDLVYGVLSGRIKGTRGESYEILQKLLQSQRESKKSTQPVKARKRNS